MFQFTVIPGAAERRPGIQSPSETLWIPAFAGMTKKTRSSRFKLLKIPPVSCMCKDQPDGRGNYGVFVQALIIKAVILRIPTPQFLRMTEGSFNLTTIQTQACSFFLDVFPNQQGCFFRIRFDRKSSTQNII